MKICCGDGTRSGNQRKLLRTFGKNYPDCDAFDGPFTIGFIRVNDLSLSQN